MKKTNIKVSKEKPVILTDKNIPKIVKKMSKLLKSKGIKKEIRDYCCKLEIYDLNDNRENAMHVYNWLLKCAHTIRFKFKEYDSKHVTFRLMK